MLVKHLCLTCRNRSHCPIAERVGEGAVIDEHATELVEEIAEPWWQDWEVRVVITTCERYEDRYTAPDAHLEAAYEERFETDC